MKITDQREVQQVQRAKGGHMKSILVRGTWRDFLEQVGGESHKRGTSEETHFTGKPHALLGRRRAS